MRRVALPHQPERLGHEQGVIAARETRVSQSLTHVSRVPELLVRQILWPRETTIASQ